MTGEDGMYWICFGDGAKGCLGVVRKDLEPSLAAEHILALADDWAQGDIADVTDRAARGYPDAVARRPRAGRRVAGRLQGAALGGAG